MNLTEEEKIAISALKKLARSWPDSLWLFSASGVLHVMKCNQSGERVMTYSGGVDQHHIAATISGIPNDGGDW